MRFATLEDWLVWQETLHPKSIDLGLARVRRVYQSLRLDHAPMFTLTVGGTNGKGSSVAMLDSILRAEGYRVGAYTSPHLLRYNERIRIDGQCADDDSICEAFERIDRARGDVSLSFFEFGTLAALDIFSNSQLDVQILEVGLGGRLDAVNIIDPTAALIASIDIDHRDWFGDSREAIGLEKAGILRAGRPAVIGDDDPPKSLLDFAESNGIRLHRQGVDFGHQRTECGWNWFGLGGRLEGLPMPALAGEHQLLNAAAVIQMLRSIRQDRPVSDAAVSRGLETVRLAGRFQYFNTPVPALADVAHNPQAAGVLAEYLKEKFPGKPIHAVFAVMRDKDVAGIVDPLKSLVERWYFPPLTLTLARAASEAELAGLFRELSMENMETGFGDVRETAETAMRNAGENGLLLVFGTFPLVAEFIALNT